MISSLLATTDFPSLLNVLTNTFEKNVSVMRQVLQELVLESEGGFLNGILLIYMDI